MSINIEAIIINRNGYFYVWLDLHEMLCVTLWQVSAPEKAHMIRAFGPRRRSNAYKRLIKERQMILLILEEVGICPVKWQDQRFINLCETHTIETAHKSLSEIYAQCASNSVYLGKKKIERWLAERARMHKLHSQMFNA